MLCARQNGFSLIEILVAFSIMALSLTMISRTLASSTRSISNLEHQQYATLLAENFINSKSSLPTEGWNEEGMNGLYHWKITSTPAIEKQIIVVKPNNIISLTAEKTREVEFYNVNIQITWNDGTKKRVISHSILLPIAKYP